MLYQCVQNILRLSLHCNGQTLFPYLRFKFWNRVWNAADTQSSYLCQKVVLLFLRIQHSGFLRESFLLFLCNRHFLAFLSAAKMFSFQLRFATIIEELSSPLFWGKYILHNHGEIDKEKVLKNQNWVKKSVYTHIIRPGIFWWTRVQLLKQFT